MANTTDETGSDHTKSEKAPAIPDELLKWMSGEGGLLSWLETDPSDTPTFYSDVPSSEIKELREKVRAYEDEIAQLREKVEKCDCSQNEGAAAENPRLLEELEKQFHAELNERNDAFQHREAELRTMVQQLKEELGRKELEDRLRQDESYMARLSDEDSANEFRERMQTIQEKEGRILELQEMVDRLNDTVQDRDDELERLREIVEYKERELTRREEDLTYRERKATEERRRLEEAKQTTGGLEEAELKKRLEELRAEVGKREKELKAKEEFLRAKEADLRRRERGIITEELEHVEQELMVEAQQNKAKTGNPRLDDLLLGGVPFGSNVLVYGPPFVGKETLINQFVAEGLKKGIPTIWVTTDKTPADLREEMKLVLPSYEEYETLGLVRYVDSYSRNMGDTDEDQYTIYVDKPDAHDQIMDAVETVAKSYMEKHEYYRLAFRTISTLIAYSNPNAAFRFLSPFCGRRKRDRAVSMYSIEKGMHGEQEIQMLGSITDGMIDFKIDQLRTFFTVRGITDVQSRSYIRYTATRHGLSIGSFALDHIK